MVWWVALVGLAWAGSELEPSDQVQGYYSDGSVQGAALLQPEGAGYVKLFRGRDRGYGSSGLVALLESVAAELRLRHPDRERLQIGDLGAEQGGRITRHGSHQNGLDADLAYLRSSGTEQDPEEGAGFLVSFVDAAGHVTGEFDVVRNWELMKLLRASGRLNRVFVDAAIKETLCAHARAVGEYESEAETLRRLRPLENHADHLHVRLTCPSTSPGCRAQAEPPEGTGCGATSLPERLPGFVGTAWAEISC